MRFGCLAKSGDNAKRRMVVSNRHHASCHTDLLPQTHVKMISSSTWSSQTVHILSHLRDQISHISVGDISVGMPAGDHSVRVLIYVSISFVRSDYVISASVGFRVVSSAVAFP